MTARRSTHARGFLFADLRGYTAFVEARGNTAAAELLRSYRAAVRTVIARFDGAEIRTEGDSFYVVFPSASDAIMAGLAILDEAVPTPGSGVVGVGVGVHAGEATETDEGYVGWAVNVAARLCALARHGELLVSETARIITHGQLDVHFIPRGRKRLKGIAEPVAVYVVLGGEAPPVRWRSRTGASTLLRRRLDRLALPLALAVGVVILTAGAIALIGQDLGGRAQEAQTPVAAATSSGSVSASPAPSEPSAADSREEVEARLRQRIDPDVARLCTSADPEDAPKVTHFVVGPLQTLGGLRCELGGAAPDVVFYWHALHESGFASPGSDVAFSTIVGQRNLPRGDCSADTRAWGTWEFGANSGELLCSGFGGEALIAWTYDGEPIVALAEREDGDSERLYRWWEDHARILGPEPGS